MHKLKKLKIITASLEDTDDIVHIVSEANAEKYFLKSKRSFGI